MQNRQLIFSPRKPYDLVAERSEATAPCLQFPVGGTTENWTPALSMPWTRNTILLWAQYIISYLIPNLEYGQPRGALWRRLVHRPREKRNLFSGLA